MKFISIGASKESYTTLISKWGSKGSQKSQKLEITT